MTKLMRTLTIVALAPVILNLSACRSKSVGDDDVAFPKTPNYKYADLIVKDYDEMHGMVQSLVRKAQAENGDGAVEHLRAALKLIFTRPDTDNMVAKLVPEVRRELVGMNAFERVIAQLAAESTENMRDKENTISVRTSASFILENLLAEIRPEAERENGEMRKTVQRLADARLDLPREIKSERKLRGMFQTTNPSEDAQKIIEGIAAREKARAKAEKAKKGK